MSPNTDPNAAGDSRTALIETADQLDGLDFDKGGGLLPVIAQDARTGEVLMLAWASREALERTLASGEMWYFSRSRDELWHKGATSGNVQRLRSLHADCDADAVLALVEPAGSACHTGSRTCFGAAPTLVALQDVLRARAADRPEGSYTARLLDDRDLRLEKLAEEATELALECARPDRDSARVAEEAADLLYHLLVACLGAGVELEDVLEVLDRRQR